jgi:hypothetical protein
MPNSIFRQKIAPKSLKIAGLGGAKYEGRLRLTMAQASALTT